MNFLNRLQNLIGGLAVLAGGACVFLAVVGLPVYAEELDLSGVWHLEQVGTNTVSCSVSVPGGIYAALYDAKFIPDPYFAQNEKLTQWPGRVEWDFSRQIDISSSFVAKRSVVLRLEDVDCFADVYLNGSKVGSTGNRFRRYDFDVKPFLKEGRNDLRVRFHSTENISYAEAKKYDRQFNIANATVTNINLVRTVQCHGGWDWGITQMDTGLMGEVRLIAVDDFRIDYIYTVQKFTEDYSNCEISVFAEITNADGTHEIAKDVVNVSNPKLWWPNGSGPQNMTSISFSVKGRQMTKRLGLRKVDIINDIDEKPDPVDGKKGRQMTVSVNGRRIFMKGADWIPCDAFENRQRGHYRQLLEDARLSHMNMVRVWGGGQFEHPEFYDLCDELGILIWHDFMFSCATYPGTDAFLSEVRKEVVHQVKRLRDHASIALWCGDNECIGAAGWFGNRDNPKLYKENLDLCAKRAAFLDGICRACDPTRTFWPSSPSLGPGNFGNGWADDSSGDMHFWGVWFGGAVFTKYYDIRPRFCSEFGYQSYPSIETALTYVRPDQLNPTAPDFYYHQKCPNGNRYILETMMVYFRYPKGVKAVHYLSQVQQAMAIRMGVEHFRHLMPRCMGAIYWQLNDNWPVASWSSIEYGGKWKHLQYHARRFYAPTVVMVVPAYKDPNTLEYWAVNEKSEALRGEARLETWDFNGRLLSVKPFLLDVPPHSARRLGSFPLAAFGTDTERKNRFLALSADGCPDNEWQFQFYRESNLADAQVKAEVCDENGVWTVCLSTDKPAFFVWVDVPGVKGVFSDDSIMLLPDRPRRLTFSRRSEATFSDFKRSLEVMHLRNSYE